MLYNRLFYSDIRNGDTFIDGEKKCIAFFDEKFYEFYAPLYEKKAFAIYPKNEFFNISKRKYIKRVRMVLVEKKICKWI